MSDTTANLNHAVIEFSRPPLNSVSWDAPASQVEHCGTLYGASPPMKHLYKLLKKVAPTDACVLLTGESGSGKELAARTLHNLSRRSHHPFVPVNCGAIAANLVEAELFGHERGSFTGAHRLHKGYFERAAGGTIFLDEIGEMAPDLQVKLLRVLEAGSFHRVGGESEIKVDVRVIAATNKSLEQTLREGNFRHDLLYRLAVFPITIPPLRERGEDVALLAQHFLSELNKRYQTNKQFSPSSLANLRKYGWPGNVRELKNVVQRAYIMGEEKLDVSLTGLISWQPDKADTVCIRVGTPLAQAEKQLIYATLAQYDGNKKKSAEILGLSLKTLYNRLHSYQTDSHELNHHSTNKFFNEGVIT